MAERETFGIDFPFQDSVFGDYLKMTETPEDEIKANLIHLLLTRKGSRYFLPDFGTSLYEYIFEPLDSPTFSSIEGEIREQVTKYIPNLRITNIIVESALETEETPGTIVADNDPRVYRVAGQGTKEHTAKVKVEFTITSDAFETRDFVIINI
jgi:phage baseplate assembly protein W